MKPLSAESLKMGVNKAPNDLSSVLRGFQIAAHSISQDMASWTSKQVFLSVENIAPIKSVPGVLNDDGKRGIDSLFIDAETGISVKYRLEQAFVLLLCEAVFGGEIGETLDQEDRPISQIESDVGQIFISAAMQKIAEAFDFPKATRFVLEAPPKKGVVTDRAPFETQFTAMLKLQLGECAMDFNCDLSPEFIAQATTHVPKETLPEVEINPNWAKKIKNTLEPSEIELVAVLAELQLRLDVISNFSAGQIIPLGVNYRKSLKIKSGTIDLYNAHLGQSNGNYCLVVDSAASEEF
jgi:flagellar motor switch protein FliM